MSKEDVESFVSSIDSVVNGEEDARLDGAVSVADGATQETVVEAPAPYTPIPIAPADGDAFNKALTEATEAKLDIENDCKSRYAEFAKEFADFMLDRVSDDFKYKVAPALGLYANIPDDLKEAKREKRRMAALRSFFKSSFNKTTDLLVHKEDQWPRDNSSSKAKALIKSIFMTLWLAKDDPDVKLLLDTVGVEINFKKPVDDISDGSEETKPDREARDSIVKEGVEVLKDTIERTLQIEENIYPAIPTALRYDAESNPKGIKKGQFTSMANVNAKKSQLESNGEMDKVKDLLQKTSDSYFYGSVNQQLLFDTFQQVQ